MNRIIAFILLLPSLAFAGTDAETIYAWGYGDILAHVIRSVKYVFANNDFIGIFKIFVVIGVILLFINIFTGKNQDPLALFKYYVISAALFYLFLSPSVFKTDVYIQDLSNNNNSQLIRNVPKLYAEVFSIFSKFEKITAELFEAMFSLPNDLRYSRAGLLSAFGLMGNANTHRIIDTNLYLSINDYINDCVFPDIVDGTKDVYALSRSSNLWADLGNTSPSRTTKYYDDNNPDGVVMTCPKAYNKITGKLNDYINQTGLPLLTKMVGAYSQSQISSALGTASDYFLGYSVSGQAYLQQAIAMNMFSEAFQNFARVNAISGTGLALGVAKAEETTRNNMVLSGVLGSKYIPIIKGILTTLIASFVPFIILLLLTPLFMRVIIGFFTILLWLSLWHIADVLINAIINVKASSFLQTIADGSYTLINKGVIDGSILDYINMVSSFYWSIPTISFVIASGFSIYAMNSLSGQMSSKAQGSTGAVAGEMATGSMNIASNVSGGRKWDFSSFEKAGISSSYAMAYTGNWGTTESIHQQTQGLIGKSSVGIKSSSISKFNKEIEDAVGYKGFNLGSDILNAVGRHDGNTYELQGGNWGDLRLLKGTHYTKDKDGNISGTIIGVDAQGNKFNLEFSHGQLLKVNGVVDGKSFEWRGGKDKDVVDVKQADGVSVSVVYDKFGNDYVGSVQMPDKVNFQEQLQKTLATQESIAEKFTKLDTAQDIFKSGTSQEKQSALKYTYSIATSKDKESEAARKYAQSTAANSLESTIEDLTRGGDRIWTKANRVDKDKVNEMALRGGISLGGMIAKFFGGQIGVEGRKAWLNKDIVYVEDKDGNFYKFQLTDKAQKTFEEKWLNELSTGKRYKTSFSEKEHASVDNQNISKENKESFFQRVSQLAKQDEANISKLKNLTDTKNLGVNNDATRQLVDVVSDITGMSKAQVLNAVNENPAILRKWISDSQILNEVSERLTGKKDGLNDFNEVKNETSTVEQDINQRQQNLQHKVNEATKGDIPKVEKKNYTKEDAKKVAKDNNITEEKSNEAFNNNIANNVNKHVEDYKNSVGLTPKIKNKIPELHRKYGDNIKEGLDDAQYLLNESVNAFNKKYGYHFTAEDIMTGKALDKMKNDTEKQLQYWSSYINTYEQLRNNEAIWNQLPEQTKQNLEKRYYEALQKEIEFSRRLSELATLQNLQRQLEEDRAAYNGFMQIESARPYIIYGGKIENNGMFKDPSKTPNYPDYKPSTNSPGYKYPNRPPEAPNPANYPNNGLGISNRDLVKQAEALLNRIKNSQIVADLSKPSGSPFEK